MVIDFVEIKKHLKKINAELDHKLLNLATPLSYRPTAEFIAMYIGARLRSMGLGVKRVRFYETPDSYADVVIDDSVIQFIEKVAEEGEGWKLLQQREVQK